MNWLTQQLAIAEKEVEAWPKWKQEMAATYFKSYVPTREDNTSYGNY